MKIHTNNCKLIVEDLDFESSLDLIYHINISNLNSTEFNFALESLFEYKSCDYYVSRDHSWSIELTAPETNSYIFKHNDFVVEFNAQTEIITVSAFTQELKKKIIGYYLLHN